MSKTYRCEKCGDMIPLDEVIERLGVILTNVHDIDWRMTLLDYKVELKQKYGV